MQQPSAGFKGQLSHCPRCVGGKLVRDWDSGLVCVNCGWYPPQETPDSRRREPVLYGNRSRQR